ncbi:hypothetical protein OGAPHI_004031 [Ogataea philodendri]|uniref:Uncharacterized protein n=1 Tax=Ogataea philodendri TaxID=1378263 RepID=A0A9P8P4X0_9ASCO|nr:uncharacterized protein OGAPHI_004031 [Ogataea philodendri]KAH3665843.1 hypothetical protein OGAPHI_004031 [Ogataea philodendri]
MAFHSPLAKCRDDNVAIDVDLYTALWMVLLARRHLVVSTIEPAKTVHEINLICGRLWRFEKDHQIRHFRVDARANFATIEPHLHEQVVLAVFTGLEHTSSEFQHQLARLVSTTKHQFSMVAVVANENKCEHSLTQSLGNLMWFRQVHKVHDLPEDIAESAFAAQELLETDRARVGHVQVIREIKIYIYDIIVFTRMHRMVTGGLPTHTIKDIEFFVQVYALINNMDYVTPGMRPAAGETARERVGRRPGGGGRAQQRPAARLGKHDFPELDAGVSTAARELCIAQPADSGNTFLVSVGDLDVSGRLGNRVHNHVRVQRPRHNMVVIGVPCQRADPRRVESPSGGDQRQVFEVVAVDFPVHVSGSQIFSVWRDLQRGRLATQRRQRPNRLELFIVHVERERGRVGQHDVSFRDCNGAWHKVQRVLFEQLTLAVQQNELVLGDHDGQVSAGADLDWLFGNGSCRGQFVAVQLLDSVVPTSIEPPFDDASIVASCVDDAVGRLGHGGDGLLVAVHNVDRSVRRVREVVEVSAQCEPNDIVCCLYAPDNLVFKDRVQLPHLGCFTFQIGKFNRCVCRAGDERFIVDPVNGEDPCRVHTIKLADKVACLAVVHNYGSICPHTNGMSTVFAELHIPDEIRVVSTNRLCKLERRPLQKHKPCVITNRHSTIRSARPYGHGIHGSSMARDLANTVTRVCSETMSIPITAISNCNHPAGVCVPRNVVDPSTYYLVISLHNQVFTHTIPHLDVSALVSRGHIKPGRRELGHRRGVVVATELDALFRLRNRPDVHVFTARLGSTLASNVSMDGLATSGTDGLSSRLGFGSGTISISSRLASRSHSSSTWSVSTPSNDGAKSVSWPTVCSTSAFNAAGSLLVTSNSVSYLVSATLYSAFLTWLA